VNWFRAVEEELLRILRLELRRVWLVVPDKDKRATWG
jgi:hypothetical protein